MSRLTIVLAIGLVAGCGSGGDYGDETIPAVPALIEIDSAATTHPPGDRPAGNVELSRGPRVSLHVVTVVSEVAPHVHRYSDETVFFWRGGGLMKIGNEMKEVRAGMVIHIPRGVPHSFRRTSPEPAIALAVYTPPFIAGDRHPVE
ncbi:MAG: cupin domain-containing protein [Planctomycetales bacterium]|nr:cupin domain-containing protein [Planctomycetales bacterium]